MPSREDMDDLMREIEMLRNRLRYELHQATKGWDL